MMHITRKITCDYKQLFLKESQNLHLIWLIKSFNKTGAYAVLQTRYEDME
jgi:hypothetical protein